MDFHISSNNEARLINAAIKRERTASEILNEIIEGALPDESTEIPYVNLDTSNLPAPNELQRIIIEVIESEVEGEASYEGYDEIYEVHHTSVEVEGGGIPDDGEDGTEVWVSGEGVLTQNFDRTSKVLDMGLSLHFVYERNEDGEIEWSEVEDDRDWSEIF